MTTKNIIANKKASLRPASVSASANADVKTNAVKTTMSASAAAANVAGSRPNRETVSKNAPRPVVEVLPDTNGKQERHSFLGAHAFGVKLREFLAGVYFRTLF